FTSQYNYRSHGFEFMSISYSGEGSVADARRALQHDAATAAHRRDMVALKECDAIVVLKRAGFSSGFELGFAIASGKPAFIVATGDSYRADLVDLEAVEVCGNVEELIDALRVVLP